MSQSAFARLRERLDEIYAELEQELAQKRDQFRYTLERGKIRFQKAAKDDHAAKRRSLIDHLKTAPWQYVITAPFIYMVIVPTVFLDVIVTVFQRVCFPVYKIPQVKRSDYFYLDRHKLNYLNIIEKFHCEYCAYVNGIFAYVSEVGSRTETFWCPIKHAKMPRHYHDRYTEFLDYGDADEYHQRLEGLRSKVRACDDCKGCAK